MIIEAADHELEPTPWATRAACRGISQPDLFFPTRGNTIAAAAAVAVCTHCPVRTECLNYALRWRIDHGIWGGTTARARRRLTHQAGRPRRFPPRHGTTSRYHQGCRCQRCTEAQMAYIEDTQPNRPR